MVVDQGKKWRWQQAEAAEVEAAARPVTMISHLFAIWRPTQQQQQQQQQEDENTEEEVEDFPSWMNDNQQQLLPSTQLQVQSNPTW